MRGFAIVLLAVIAGTTSGSPGQSVVPVTDAQTPQRVALLRAAGRAIFFDAALSASGKQSCASCHDPAHRYNPPTRRDVQLGGPTLRVQGLRAPLTMTYLDRVPPYDNHFYDSEDEADNSIDNGPTGGLTWDGRVDTGAAQAAIPLTSEFEMASSPAAVARVAQRAAWAPLLRAALGDSALADPASTLTAIGRALDAFEEDADEFAPYTSKYDAYLTGRVELSASEQRGLTVFNAVDKGNCAQCHLSQRGRDGTPPALSDYGLIALAVPRNPHLVRNRDPAFFDLGACGPERQDKAGQAEFCGLFRTPTLRNVALRGAFFHNGLFHDLRQVIEFYLTRDITPERWYRRDARGKTVIYDDVPAPYQGNINRDPPFDGQHPGAEPRLSQGEVDDLLAFLNTLTDGYLPSNPYRQERAESVTQPNR